MSERFGGFENSAPVESFEDQFAKREKIKVAGGTAEVVDVKPETLKSEVPLLMASGFGMSLDVSKMGIEAMFKSGRRTIGMSHPRFGGSMKEVSKDLLEKYPQEELRKALNIIEAIEQKGIDKVDVVAHSDSGIVISIAAAIRPEKFNNIVFFAPAGLIGADTLTRLLKDWAGQGKQAESLKASDGRAKEIPITENEKNMSVLAAKSLVSYFRNPVRSVKEVLGISKMQTHELLRYIHGRGVGIVVIAPVDDPVFPIDQMSKVVGPEHDKMIDGFVSVRGGHGEIANSYKAGSGEIGAWLDLSENMLTNLERKKEEAE